MFEVTNAVPIPEDLRISKRIYPFQMMKPGSSFLVPLGHSKMPADRRMRSISSASRHFRNKSKEARTWKFACRAEVNGVRCWRVK